MDADVEVDVVRAEAATVLSAMRLTTGRWMPQLRFERELPPELEQPLVRALRELSARAQLPSDAREVASPFISVLSSPHAHAPVLHAAAAALSNLIGLGLLAGRLDHASDACCEVADAVVGRLSRAELGGGGALGTPEVLEPLAQRLLSLLILLPSSRLSASSLDGCIRAALGAACAERASTQCRIGAEAALTQLTASAFARVRARPAPPAPVVDVLAELLHHFAERAPHPLALEAMLVALRSSGRALGTHGALVEAVRGPVCSAALLLGRSRELSALAQALRLMACVVATLRSRAVGGVGEFWASVLLEHEPPPERQELLLEAAGAWLQLPGIAGFLYVSFDCALHGANLLEQTVASLCVQAMPRADGGALAAPSMLALRALVSLLAALAGGGAGAGADAAGAGAGDVGELDHARTAAMAIGRAPDGARPAGGLEAPARRAQPTSPAQLSPDARAAAAERAGGGADGGPDSMVPRAEAFGMFKVGKGKGTSAQLLEHKEAQRRLREQLKAHAAGVNALKARIDAETSALASKREERARIEARAAGGDAASPLGGSDDVIIDEEEYAHIKALKELKTAYRDEHDAYQSASQGLARETEAVDSLRTQLLKEFDEWYDGAPLDVFQPVKKGNAGADAMDNEEAFELMQQDRVRSAEPDSVAFFNANMSLKKRGKHVRPV